MQPMQKGIETVAIECRAEMINQLVTFNNPLHSDTVRSHSPVMMITRRSTTPTSHRSNTPTSRSSNITNNIHLRLHNTSTPVSRNGLNGLTMRADELRLAKYRETIEFERQRKELTFHPQIYNKQDAPCIAVRPKQSKYYELLSKSPRDGKKERELQKQRELKECTFKPNIQPPKTSLRSRTPSWSLAHSASCTSTSNNNTTTTTSIQQNATTRLYKDALARDRRFLERRHAAIEAEKEWISNARRNLKSASCANIKYNIINARRSPSTVSRFTFQNGASSTSPSRSSVSQMPQLQNLHTPRSNSSYYCTVISDSVSCPPTPAQDTTIEDQTADVVVVLCVPSSPSTNTKDIMQSSTPLDHIHDDDDDDNKELHQQPIDRKSISIISADITTSSFIEEEIILVNEVVDNDNKVDNALEEDV